MQLLLLPIKLLSKPLTLIITKPILLVTIAAFIGGGFFFFNQYQNFSNKVSNLLISEDSLKIQLDNTKKELDELKKTDQIKKNLELEGTIKSIEKTYKQSVAVYEKILDYQGATLKKNKFTEQFAKSLKLLSDRNYGEAEKTLAETEKQITEETQKAATEFKIPENVKVSNTPPSSGYSRQSVQTDIGTYLVDIISADLGSTRVIVDTASDSDCRDNCPVLPLGDYVSRNGAFAAVNGSYFCPADYPSCAGKTNSFDTLVMNKNKKYLNSDNNVYSSVPAAIFQGGSVRYVRESSSWGRDTGVDGVIANHPLMVLDNNIIFGGGSDPKQGSKGSRSFVGSTGSTVYIGVVRNVTVAESAIVLHKMGIQNALNLDSGGSTALWSGGYKAGPGRSIPNAILFVRK